jgi:stress response protein SCP2/predicted type IV restriction endonuclease
MKNLQKGENIALTQAGIIGANIFSGISWITNDGQHIDIDVSAFLLNAQGKVSSDSDFIFYNQPEDTDKSILFDNKPDNGNDIKLFSIKTNKIPAYINKIVFVATIDKTVGQSIDFNCVSDLCIRIFEHDAFNEKMINFKLAQADKETSIALGELYLHQSNWKFRALGHGFESGLAALAQSYGVDLSDDNSKKEENTIVKTSENNDRLFDQTMVENEIRINKQIRKFLPKIKNAVKQQLNESNTRMLLDKVFIDILGYKMDEVKAEVRIQGRKADYVLAVGNEDILVVEAKKAGMPLKEEQIFQATSYGAYSGIQYVLLTNLNEFMLFKVKTDGIVETDVIFSIDLLNDFGVEDIKKLALISRYGMNKPELLEKLCRQVAATSPENIARLLVSNEVLDAIQAVIKREQNCEVTNEQIQETIEIFLNVTFEVFS